MEALGKECMGHCASRLGQTFNCWGWEQKTCDVAII